MLDQTLDQIHLPRRRNVRLDTLLRLRWLAIIGQTTAALIVYYGLDFPLPIWACLAVIALSAWLNVALRVRFSLTQRLEPERAAWLLAFDIAELAGQEQQHRKLGDIEGGRARGGGGGAPGAPPPGAPARHQS